MELVCLFLCFNKSKTCFRLRVPTKSAPKSESGFVHLQLVQLLCGQLSACALRQIHRQIEISHRQTVQGNHLCAEAAEHPLNLVIATLLQGYLGGFFAKNDKLCRLADTIIEV